MSGIARADGDLPEPVALRSGPQRQVALLAQEQLRPAAGAFHPRLDQGNPRLVEEGLERGGDLAPGCLGECREQVVGVAAAIRVGAQIRADPVAEAVRPEEPLEHRQDAAALLVGDGVELVPDVLDVLERLPHRASARQRVLLHRVVHAAEEARPRSVSRIPFLDRAVAHPGGERLVEPGIRPPAQRHPVAEPLVRHLVRHHRRDRLARLLRADPRLEEQDVFPVQDGPGVLHRAVRVIGGRHVIELVEGELAAEVALQAHQ